MNFLVWLLGLICAVWVIYDVAANQKKMTTGIKVSWIVFALIFSILTAIVYYFVVKRK